MATPDHTLTLTHPGVAAFCEEDEDTVVNSDVCNEYFDPAVPESICRPSCVWGSVTGSKPKPEPKRFSLDWNASGVSDCHVQNNTCELGKIVFCDGEGPVSNVKKDVNGLGCMADECKERYCYDFSFGLGEAIESSDYIGPGSA